MSKNGQTDEREDSRFQEQASEHGNSGRSGEGAASAMAQVISQIQQRHQIGGADDATGGSHSQ